MYLPHNAPAGKVQRGKQSAGYFQVRTRTRTHTYINQTVRV